nr:sentrin-specific protease 1-like [Rhipicephalus microplus]
MGDSNVARVRNGVLTAVKKDGKVRVEAQSMKSMVDALAKAQEVVDDSMKGENLTIIHAGLNDVLKGKDQNFQRQLEDEWYAALKKRLSITVRSCAPKQRQLDRGSVVHDVEGVMLPGLTSAMVHEVEAALVPTPPDEVLASVFRLNISRADMLTLTDTQWFNDQVINFYMNLLMQQSQKEGFPTIYAFNTFFYPKLVQGSHAALKRWMRTVDLFSFDIILVALHVTAHWCLAVVDFRKPHIAYYDSLNSEREQPQCLATLQKYLEDESLHKRSYGLNWDCWTFKVMDVPQQENYNDCAMFACQFAECISRDTPISFGQQHMPYFRKRVVYEILHKTILSV